MVTRVDGLHADNRPRAELPGAIEHIVLVEWAKTVEIGTLAELARLSRRIRHTVPGIRALTEGTSVSPEKLEGGFDWALLIRFEDTSARDAYLPHPEHLPLAKLIGAHAERVVVFDVIGT